MSKTVLVLTFYMLLQAMADNSLSANCPSTAFLPVQPHYANVRRNSCRDLNSCPLRELDETTRTPSYYMDEDYPARPKIQ